MLVFVYFDDILVLGTTAQQTQKHLDMVLETLEEAGFMVNQKKSSQVPQRVLEHLGFQIDFQQGHLAVPGGKIKTCRKELGKLVTFSSMTPRKMAAILGTVRSFLTAMPFLRAFTNHMLSFVDLHSSRGCDCQLPIPPILKAEVLRIKDLMISWSGRLFQGHCPVRTLHSDSSSHGWAGVDLTGKKAIQEFWRDQGGLHINIKELTAALHTVKSLAKRNERVTLVVDNSVPFSYLRKGGGRKHHLNLLMQDLWEWCMERKIHLHPKLVPSVECQADFLSRTPLDKGDYTFHHQTFLNVLENFQEWIQPSWDMFASPGNCKFPLFVSRYPHWQAQKSDALNCNLDDIFQCYANPPWTCISQWLHRLWENPHLICLMITPHWVSAPWWPLLAKLRVPKSPVLEVSPFQGLFINSAGHSMPPTRWPLICTLLSGKNWRSNKFQVKVSKRI